jgi:hypothetical protein
VLLEPSHDQRRQHHGARPGTVEHAEHEAVALAGCRPGRQRVGDRADRPRARPSTTAGRPPAPARRRWPAPAPGRARAATSRPR